MSNNGFAPCFRFVRSSLVARLVRPAITAIAFGFSTTFLLIAIQGPVAAQDGEFPKEWYFDSMQPMREKLEGRPAPELSTDTWIGDETTLEDSLGKVVVLDFWATWCGPCVASIPKNVALVEEHPDDLVFIGMHSATSGWDKADKMVDDREINYPVVLDTGDTADAYQITGFPTYVVIDAEGIVRAAGVLPTFVKKVVERLLEESGSSGRATLLASLNRDWFYTGAKWMRPWQDQFGQPAKPVQAKAWWLPGDEETGNDETAPKDKSDSEADQSNSEADEPVSDAVVTDTASDEDGATPEGYSESDLEGLVRVLHFTRPGMSITDKQLERMNDTAKRYSPQGVVFTAVCDHESDWKKTKEIAAKLNLEMPLVLDRVASEVKADDDEMSESDNADSEPADDAASQSSPREAGETARSYNIRIAPVTVLIDRQGRIRATGLRVEQLEDALEMLLAEQAG